MPNPWFQPFNPKNTTAQQLPKQRLRLYCFHHAGASCQYFQPWANKLPTWIELIGVQLPGRWNRIQEPAFLRMEQLTPVVAEAFKSELANIAGQAYAFYGHSVGGLVAYELTRYLTSNKLQLPVHLFISSKRAVPLPTAQKTIYHLPDHEFEAAITYMYGGLPPEITAEPDMKKLFLDITKKDMELLDTYQYVKDPVLNVPMTIIGGTEDHVVNLAELQPWEGLTTAGMQIIQFPGDHFFLRSQQSEPKLLELISKTLEPFKIT